MGIRDAAQNFGVQQAHNKQQNQRTKKEDNRKSVGDSKKSDVQKLLDGERPSAIGTTLLQKNVQKQGETRTQVAAERFSQQTDQDIDQEVSRLFKDTTNFGDKVILQSNKQKSSANAAKKGAASAEQNKNQTQLQDTLSKGMGMMTNTQDMKNEKTKKSSTEKTVQHQESEEDSDGLMQSTVQQGAVSQNKQLQKKRRQQIARHNERSAGEEGEGEAGIKKEAVKSFLTAFSETVTDRNKKAHQKGQNLEQAKKKLKEEGYSPKQIQSMEMGLSTLMRKNLKAKLKESFTQNYLMMADEEENPLDMLKSKEELRSMMVYIFGDEKLIKGQNKESALRNEKMSAWREISGFVDDEIASTYAKSQSSPEAADKLQKELNKLTKLASKIGGKPEEILEQAKTKASDLGYLMMEIPDTEKRKRTQFETESGTISLMDLGCSLFEGSEEEGDDRGKERKSHHELSVSEEKDLLLDRLRAIYMKRAVNGDFKTQLETIFEVRTLKNGLVRLGVYNDDMMAEVQQEAKALAVVQLMDMLKEGFEERATFPSEKSKEYKSVARKIKVLLANMRKVGAPLSKKEVVSIRNEADYRIFGITKMTLENVNYKLKLQPDHRGLNQVKSNLVKVLMRLKEEAQISEALPDEISLDIEHERLDMSGISSAA